MRRLNILLASAALLCAVGSAFAQQPGPAQHATPEPQPATQPAPPRSYQPVPIKLPAPANDPSFDTFRKQLADVATKKDRSALAKLVVSKGFFWEGPNGDNVDKHKSSVDNLAVALGLGSTDGTGWDGLVAAAGDPTLEPIEDHKGVMCGPASPDVDEKALEALTQATGTESEEWGFTTAAGLEVRATAQPNAPIIETLGLQLVRVLADDSDVQGGQSTAPMVRVVAPSGKVGYLPADGVSPLNFDQLCYVKEAAGWKIAGYASGDPGGK